MRALQLRLAGQFERNIGGSVHLNRVLFICPFQYHGISAWAVVGLPVGLRGPKFDHDANGRVPWQMFL